MFQVNKIMFSWISSFFWWISSFFRWITSFFWWIRSCLCWMSVFLLNKLPFVEWVFFYDSAPVLLNTLLFLLNKLIFSSHRRALQTALSQRAGAAAAAAVEGKFHIFCNNLNPVYRIQAKFGMDILLNPRNKPVEEFFIFLKIQDGRRRPKKKLSLIGRQCN